MLLSIVLTGRKKCWRFRGLYCGIKNLQIGVSTYSITYTLSALLLGLSDEKGD